MTRNPQEPTARAERTVEALDELYRASGQIHAGGLQPDLNRFERARIEAGMALRLVPAAATERLEASPLGPPKRPGWIGVRLRDAFWRDDYYITGKYNHRHPDHTTVAHDTRDEPCRFSLLEPIYPYDRNRDDRGQTRLVRSEGSDTEPAAMSLLDRDTYNRLAGSAEPDGGGA